MAGSPRLFLTTVSLPLEINSCLVHNGGCHAHAECIPTGPQQVSRRLDAGASVQTRFGVALSFRALCSHNDQEFVTGLLQLPGGLQWRWHSDLQASGPLLPGQASHPITFVKEGGLRVGGPRMGTNPRMVLGPP